MLPLIAFAMYTETLADRYGDIEVTGHEFVGTLAPRFVLLGFLLPDLLLTVFAAIALRRPACYCWPRCSRSCGLSTPSSACDPFRLAWRTQLHWQLDQPNTPEDPRIADRLARHRRDAAS